MARLIWHRRDLRLRDNELYHRGGRKIYSLFVFDPSDYAPRPTGISDGDGGQLLGVTHGPHFARGLLDAVHSLRSGLQSLGGELIVRTGDPSEVIPQLARALQVEEVAWSEIPGSYECDQSEKLKKQLMDGPHRCNIANQDDDKRIKKDLLLDTITENSASSSDVMLQKIHHAVNEAGDGSRLEAKVLSGGYTNYSYKVFVDKHPELVIFAKLCFEAALWNPDPDAFYDLKRTSNEYEIMKKVSSHAPDCVVPPLALWDLDQDGQKMKVLVTEWSKADEQFCNQFIDGTVDPRIAPKIAATLAALHNIKDYDPDFNSQVNDCVLNLFSQIRQVELENSRKTNPKDRTEAYSASLGEEVLMKSIDAIIADCTTRECLMHSDAHVFNMLVEAKPSVAELENFGPEGTFVLSKDSILAYIHLFLDAYICRMVESGKTEEEAASILRKGLAWGGYFAHAAFYIMNVQIEAAPVESEEQMTYVRDSMGTLGLKLIRLGFDADFVSASAGLNEIRQVFGSLLEEEVALAADAFASGRRKKQPRKSSMLRATNRRFSDAAMYRADSVRSLSSSRMDSQRYFFIGDIQE
ncbi:hypothetical protein ACHAXT_006789 [Thalassiosira profunda]